MSGSTFDVIVIGAGAAGLSAAIGLARTGFRVIVVEAAPFPGAENWSGCVYFCENLAHPELLGPEGVEALAWERRLVERGFFLTDGNDILGLGYRDPVAFKNCYTVLRPIFDHHLGQIAAGLGVLILSSTTAESLIRQRGRVIGVCTNRGPVYADLTFLAEGDASHLVTREGYETVHPSEGPKFLQGIKEVIDLPPGAIESSFGVGAEEGVAYEMLLRNGTLHGKPVQLNMGGFLYTNRQSLSVGLVLPADNLHEHFKGDPNLLIEWFENLPALRPWLKQGKRGVFGAKLIRGGGIREVPRLVVDGLAIGGAASGIGIDFPYPNFTGPATFTGLLLSRAVRAIRAEKGTFTKAELERHYLVPLQRSHYWQDVEFLRHWPGYVKKTTFFFGENLDLALGSARLWTKPGETLGKRWGGWMDLLRGADRPEVREDVAHLGQALRLQEVAQRPPVWRLVLDGFLTTLRDLCRQPRVRPGEGGEVRLHYRHGDQTGGEPPAFLQRWFARFRPVIAAAARLVYRNDDTPLSRKLPAAVDLLTRRVSLVDVLSFGLVALIGYLRGPKRGTQTSVFGTRKGVPDLTPLVARAAQNWEPRLAELAYDSGKETHIHLLWPMDIAAKNKVVEKGLWHVCPAHVYEARTTGNGQLQVVVNFENCIKCETCWRTSDLVDWGRDGLHRFIYPVTSAATARVLEAADAAGRNPLPLPRYSAGWAGATDIPIPDAEQLRLLDQLSRELKEFDRALTEEPRTVDQQRLEYLKSLARLARQTCDQMNGSTKETAILIADLCSLAASREQRAQNRQLSWAAADGRQIRAHHLALLRRGCEPKAGPATEPTGGELEEILGPNPWRGLERGERLTAEQSARLLALLVRLADGDSAARRRLLADLGRQDPSLAIRAAHHLWAHALLSRAHLDLRTGWACVVERTASDWLAPSAVDAVVFLDGDRVSSCNATEATLQTVETLGLRGAALARIRSDIPAEKLVSGLRDEWATQANRDLAAIAAGMADLLCRRAIAHATSRVQFPGLFHDEQNRDTIAKFGAIKRLVAQAAARRWAIENLDDPGANLDAVAWALGCAIGSVAYNAGQVFGGMAFSEDDVLARFYRDAATWRFLGPGTSASQRSAGVCFPELAAVTQQLAARSDTSTDESATYLLRVWLDEFSAEVDRCQALASPALPPFPGAGPALTSHDEFLKNSSPYESGDFLLKSFDPARPRVVPELVECDPFLAGVNADIREAMRYFETPRDGLLYERWLEKNHRPSAEDLEYLRQHGYFRFPVPREFGGEGRRKLEYYLLVINTQLHADFAVSLTIQVSSSLGTTPILLARDRVLPKAIKDLTDPAQQQRREELERRREACATALRWVAAGHISGFALTEPAAGSDTARVATRAVPQSVPVEREADGVLRFTLAGKKERRYLIDASRLEFRIDGVFYRWADGQEPAQIHFEEYDYETDDPAKTPYYLHGSRRVNFCDIAQLRQRDGQLWYDYWELNGTKMWITNGRVCGMLCLYARTAEGVTGFIVDRHAEGLFIGKDEAKLGQRGSPTNEVSLVGVRVPRENVLGLEGRGQVNALETLNVGRCGIGTSAMAQLRSVRDLCRLRLGESAKPQAAEEDWRMRCIEEELFIAEALAFDVIGRLEHKETKSLRLESAIVKMLNTEALHRAIDLAEEIHGLAGQTCDYLIEKRRRDARVLTIYEGTNEVQRFSILRELEIDVTPRRSRTPHARTLDASPAVQELEVLRGSLWEKIDTAVSLLGPGLWQNPNIQASLFVLAEAVAWFKAADSALGRLAWLAQHRKDESQEIGRRAFGRCLIEVRQRVERTAVELERLRRGFYHPSVRAAELLFAEVGRAGGDQRKTPVAHAPGSPGKSLSILVIVEPTLASTPRAQVEGGRLVEPYRVLGDADRSALEVALRLREQMRGSLHVATVGRPAVAGVLREALALGADEAHLVVTTEVPAPAASAAALARLLERQGPFDLILAGDDGRSEEGMVARLTAAALNIPGAGRGSHLVAGDEVLRLTDAEGGAARLRSLPAFVAIEAALPLRGWSIAGYLTGLSRPLHFHPWPGEIPVLPAQLESAGIVRSANSIAVASRPLSAGEAALQVLDNLGTDRAGPGGVMYAGSLEEVSSLSGAGVVAILGAGPEGQLGGGAPAVLAASSLAALRAGTDVLVLVLVPSAETAQRRAVGRIRDTWSGNVAVVPLPQGADALALRSRLLIELWPGLGLSPRIVLAEDWAEEALAVLGPLTPRLERVALAGSYLLVESRRAGGRLLARRLLAMPPPAPLWLSLNATVEVEAPGEGTHRPSAGTVRRWTPRLASFHGRADIRRLVEELKRETGLVRLSDAEVIVDVGFGIGNRDGYEAVIAPLEQVLREAGARSLVVGGSRKVTEELRLLPLDRQIGQSGVRVRPRLLLAIGVSGAPQHLDYIDPGTIIVAFNRDPEAPLMTLNQRTPRPRVFPVVGDLFETVPGLTAALREANGDGSES